MRSATPQRPTTIPSIPPGSSNTTVRASRATTEKHLTQLALDNLQMWLAFPSQATKDYLASGPFG